MVFFFFFSGLPQLQWIPRLVISGHPNSVYHLSFPISTLFFPPARALVPGQPLSERVGPGSGAGNLTMAAL